MICNPQGSGYDSCTGETLPGAEDCSTPVDEDCDGAAPSCTGAALWSLAFGQSSHDEALAVAIDRTTGNVVVGGGFSGSVDFGGITLVSAGEYDAFLAVYSAGGSLLWAKRFGDGNAQRIREIEVDSGGGIVVAGELWGSIDLGGGVLTATTPGEPDIFLARFDSQGTHQFSRAVAASVHYGPRLALRNDGGILLAGGYSGTANFGAGPVAAVDASDVFVMRLDAQGILLWVKIFGGSLGQEAFSVRSDSNGDVIVAGPFQGQLDFGGGPLVGPVYVAKLDGNGDHVWSMDLPTTGGSHIWGAAIDANDNILLTGYVQGTLDFGDGATVTYGGDGSESLFVTKLDSSGAHVWSFVTGEDGNQVGNAIAVDDTGSALVTGTFAQSMNLGTSVLSSSSGADPFLIKFGSDGTPLYGHAWGGSGGEGRALATGADETCVVVGDFGGTINFGINQWTSHGLDDGFIIKLAP